MITNVPLSVRNVLAEHTWLDYIPFFRNARFAKVAELYEEAGDNAGNNYLTAADYYESSAQYFADIGSSYRSAVLRMKAAQQYVSAGYLDKSNMQYLVASDIFKEISKLDCYVICIGHIAKNFWIMGEYECAVKYYEICVKHNVALGKPINNVEYLDNLGTIWSVHMGKYHLATTVYERLVCMTGDYRFKYVLGLLNVICGVPFSKHLDKQFMATYYGEYLNLLANCPAKAVELYEVYKVYVGECVLLNILLESYTTSKNI